MARNIMNGQESCGDTTGRWYQDGLDDWDYGHNSDFEDESESESEASVAADDHAVWQYQWVVA